MPPDVEIAAAIAAAYAICMALGALWLDLDSSGALWRGLNYFGRDRLMISWRWGLPALIKGQYRGDSIRPNDPRNGLLRRPRRRRRCGIFAAPAQYSPDRQRAPQGRAGDGQPEGKPRLQQWKHLSRLGCAPALAGSMATKKPPRIKRAANFLSAQAACRFSSSASIGELMMRLISPASCCRASHFHPCP
jgi:hypothetical protein